MGPVASPSNNILVLTHKNQQRAAQRDLAHGKQIFRGQGRCISSHVIPGPGSILRPDVSSAGRGRALIEIRDAWNRPRSRSTSSYQQAEVAATDSRRFSGIVKNEDNFSLQVLTFLGGQARYKIRRTGESEEGEP